MEISTKEGDEMKEKKQKKKKQANVPPKIEIEFIGQKEEEARIEQEKRLRAEKEAICILKEYRPRRCIIHWFNGNREQLQQLLDIGCYFSLNSNMVTNEKTKETLYSIPKTRVLIESDGPFTKIDGKKYTFNNLIKIYELVARYYNEPDIIKIVHANFRDVLSK